MTGIVFSLLALQAALIAWFARSAVWRATGWSALASLIVVFLLWKATDGGRTSSEAWLVLTSLPLVAVGVFGWSKPLGKLALGMGILLTAALLFTWRWASISQATSETTAVVIYASLVLVAMVALFMITGVMAMRLLVEHSRRVDAKLGDRPQQ